MSLMTEGKQIMSIQKETMKSLQDYPWSGNVPELESVLERSVILCPGPVLQLADNLEFSFLNFQSFSKTSWKKRIRRRGVGLAICRKIVERRHGRITAKSKPGRGVVLIFAIYFKSGACHLGFSQTLQAKSRT